MTAAIGHVVTKTSPARASRVTAGAQSSIRFDTAHPLKGATMSDRLLQLGVCLLADFGITGQATQINLVEGV
jgi:hypothetical protein